MLMLPNGTIEIMNDGLASRRQITRRLDNLNCSADQKAILSKLLEAVYRIGSKVIEVGRSILTFALRLVNVAPGATFGLIVGAAMSALIAGVPLLGPMLSAVLGPLLIAFGLGTGAISDLINGQLADRFAAFTSTYAPLSA